MTVVESITSTLETQARFPDYRRDSLTLTWEDRRQGHGRRRSDGGVEFAISLPSGAVLKQGDCLVLEDAQIVVEIHEAAEPVVVMRPQTPQEWAFFAYQVGNRHQPVMIGDTELVFPENAAVKSLLDQLHATYTSDIRPFRAALANIGHSH